uniref:Secreted protein n=1 Tax=Zea mays TaxID=4577 RepID=B7ZXM6_MAIZE|nr:unknown [Zea mays]
MICLRHVHVLLLVQICKMIDANRPCVSSSIPWIVGNKSPPMQASRSREVFLLYPIHNGSSFRLSVVNIVVNGEELQFRLVSIEWLVRKIPVEINIVCITMPSKSKPIRVHCRKYMKVHVLNNESCQ